MKNEWRVAYAVVDGVSQFVIWRLKNPHRGKDHNNKRIRRRKTKEPTRGISYRRPAQ